MQEFEELYRTYYPQIYRYLLKLCQDEALADEITQETFFKVLKSAEGFRGDCKFFVWMCQIAKNTFYSYVKKHGRSADFPEELPAEETNPETLAADKDMALRIHEILHVIEEPYREVFWMRTFGELSFREIADIHRKSESWARVTYHRAKMKIKSSGVMSRDK